MLEEFWSYIDSFTVPPVIIGYNILSFDAPFLRLRSLINGIQSTSMVSFGIESRTIDLIRKLFPSNGFAYRKFSEVAQALGIPHDNSVSGNDMPRLWSEGNYEAIKVHCLDDIRGEWMLYERMKKCGLE